jgi:uncharacterized protein (DUF952 family)
MSDVDVIFHLVAAEYYRDSDSSVPYTPATFEDEGFIHCTKGADNVAAVGNRYYKDDRRMYIALVIEREKVGPEIRYAEGDTDRIYPHIHGPLNRNAIIERLPVLREADGGFLAPNLKLR